MREIRNFAETSSRIIPKRAIILHQVDNLRFTITIMISYAIPVRVVIILCTIVNRFALHVRDGVTRAFRAWKNGEKLLRLSVYPTRRSQYRPVIHRAPEHSQLPHGRRAAGPSARIRIHACRAILCRRVLIVTLFSAIHRPTLLPRRHPPRPPPPALMIDTSR